MLAQFLDKGHYLLRLHTDAAIHRLWQTGYDMTYTLLVNDIDDSLYTSYIISSVDDSKRTGQYTLWVTKRYPYPLVANIKTQTARNTPPRY